MNYSLGIDIGGTFTDVVLYNHVNARVFSHKELTTPDNPTLGAVRGIRTLLDREAVGGDQVVRVVHATTLFTNALIERRGARTGLITSVGFRDTLEMRREFKYDLYDLFVELPAVLIPREARVEALERVRADGSIDMPLDPASVIKAGRELVEQGIVSVAIVFLHAYANPAHERQARDILQREFPNLRVCISSEVSPQIREYERTSTTAANAYVLPLADEYLRDLETQLKTVLAIDCPLLMMLSNGGLTHVGEARRFPVQLLESGPAAGAIAAAWFSRRSGISNVLAFDMGGTTAKLAIIEENKPLLAHSFEAAREKRFAAGSGLPINIATVELIEIGAGGGSIARLDSMNLLKVGPESAGSKPGPACYGRGGTRPTVTDANLLLGHLDPETFAGGTMKLSVDVAKASVSSALGALKTTSEKAVEGVLAIVNENMAAAARVHVAERGFDSSQFALLVTGGGGPLHACDVARRLGIKRVICPPNAGVASALGLLIAPARVDRSITLARWLSDVTVDALEAAFSTLEADAAEVMRRTLVEGSTFKLERSADIRFSGQGFELLTQLSDGPWEENAAESIRQSFMEKYERIFGQTPPVQDIELINLRVAAVEEGVERPLDLAPSERTPWKAKASSREVWQADKDGMEMVKVYPIATISGGDTMTGPLVLEDDSSTLVLPNGAIAFRDVVGNVIVDLI